ncbi:phosphatase PAP2 family protein [Archangium violaceum]|uniref:phosphatase PAP2 family protein n=1 Tax=Archangium violaceum TaxID=83451 RepID=UPI00193B59F7|nr:phosphatase PAP2 family protein [Archangium violaceum]QRK04343.1 phosphatase PAP2 family protein [Archangium violaceum]
MSTLFDFLWGPWPIIALQSWVGAAPFWTSLAHLVSLVGDTAGALVLVSLVRWRAGRIAALELAGLFMLTGLVDLALWELVGLPRPDDPRIVVRADPAVSSFPSGHTVTSLALLGWLALGRQLPRAVPWVVVPLVMLARLYLGAHYLGDVLGGVLIGLLLLGGYTRLWPTLRRWGERRSIRFFASFGLGMVATLACGVLLFGGDRRAWQVLGFAAGLVVGALLEHKPRGNAPAPGPHARTPREMALGGAVLLALLAPAHLGAAPPLQGLLYFLAMLWGALFYPPPAFRASRGP